MDMIVGVKEKNLKLVQAFAKRNYWEEAAAELFSADFTLTLPFAPPGWIERMSAPETQTHFAWLRRTVKDWQWSNTRVFATNLPDIFWIFRDGEGDVFWAARDGHFQSRFLTRVTVENGRIAHIRDHFDNCRVYEAIGVTLPLFTYDAPAAAAMPPRAHVPALAGEAMLKNAVAAVKSMVCVDFWEEGCGEIYADDFVHGLPFTPPNMPRYYNLSEYDALNVWLQENTKTWDVYPGTVLYETDSEGEYIIESGGSGFTTWSGIEHGFYQNRHVSYLKVENGYAVRFDEYFNPLNKFNSINIRIPSFPYLY